MSSALVGVRAMVLSPAAKLVGDVPDVGSGGGADYCKDEVGAGGGGGGGDGAFASAVEGDVGEVVGVRPVIAALQFGAWAWQVVLGSCMALPGVELGGTGMPSLRRTSSMRSRMMKTSCLAMGLGVEGKVAEMRTRMAARGADEVAGAGVEGGAEVAVRGAGVAPVAGATGAGELGAVAGAVEVVAGEPVAGWKVPTVQVSTCGAKVTLSPFIPLTRRPLTVAEPEPWRELSGSTERWMGLPEFAMWTMRRSGVFSTA